MFHHPGAVIHLNDGENFEIIATDNTAVYHTSSVMPYAIVANNENIELVKPPTHVPTIKCDYCRTVNGIPETVSEITKFECAACRAPLPEHVS